jgi:adenine-specific DNA-methyltransferase
VLDTKHFSAAFKDKLVASIDNLDEKTNGVLVNSENFQALRLLVNKYSEKIQCVYIDPPYNTPFSEILYKNNYKHSSWLGLLHNTIPFVKKF